jgi:Holliday junction DNA helicase RuvA
MIAMLKGTVAEVEPKYLVLDVGGVGYKVFAPEGTLGECIPGADMTFFIHTIVREDALDLYGFVTKNDKGLFEALISVSSIGPKTALNILSLVSAEALTSAIRSGSTAHLVKVSGIGKKTAEKIVIELQDKLPKYSTIDARGTSGLSKEMSSDMDVIEALKALGYDADEAREALKGIDKEIKDTGAKIKAALKKLS